MVLFQNSIFHLFVLSRTGRGEINSSCHDLVNNVGTAPTHEILDSRPEEHSEDEFIKVNSESGCDNKDKDVSREYARQHLDKELP